MRVHGTCVEVFGHGVLLRGPSGCGKSDLALRLIDRGARLVADDQVELTAVSGAAQATSPATISGRMEVRGVGIVQVETTEKAPVTLVVDLVAPGEVPRLPDRGECRLAGIALPSISLAPFEASAEAKIRIAIRDGRLCNHDQRVFPTKPPSDP